ncbi:hypothetical protein GW17_00006641 [Ensete ventricosum]|nr:hypothetical protein GW17_00006641 [Ensete ventricosum]
MIDQPQYVSLGTTWTTTSVTRQPEHARPEIVSVTLCVIPVIVGPTDRDLGNRRRRRSVQVCTPVQLKAPNPLNVTLKNTHCGPRTSVGERAPPTRREPTFPDRSGEPQVLRGLPHMTVGP